MSENSKEIKQEKEKKNLWQNFLDTGMNVLNALATAQSLGSYHTEQAIKKASGKETKEVNPKQNIFQQGLQNLKDVQGHSWTDTLSTIEDVTDKKIPLKNVLGIGLDIGLDPTTYIAPFTKANQIDNVAEAVRVSESLLGNKRIIENADDVKKAIQQGLDKAKDLKAKLPTENLTPKDVKKQLKQSDKTVKMLKTALSQADETALSQKTMAKVTGKEAKTVAEKSLKEINKDIITPENYLEKKKFLGAGKELFVTDDFQVGKKTANSLKNTKKSVDAVEKKIETAKLQNKPEELEKLTALKNKLENSLTVQNPPQIAKRLKTLEKLNLGDYTEDFSTLTEQINKLKPIEDTVEFINKIDAINVEPTQANIDIIKEMIKDKVVNGKTLQGTQKDALNTINTVKRLNRKSKDLQSLSKRDPVEVYKAINNLYKADTFNEMQKASSGLDSLIMNQKKVLEKRQNVLAKQLGISSEEISKQLRNYIERPLENADISDEVKDLAEWYKNFNLQSYNYRSVAKSNIAKVPDQAYVPRRLEDTTVLVNDTNLYKPIAMKMLNLSDERQLKDMTFDQLQKLNKAMIEFTDDAKILEVGSKIQDATKLNPEEFLDTIKKIANGETVEANDVVRQYAEFYKDGLKRSPLIEDMPTLFEITAKETAKENFNSMLKESISPYISTVPRQNHVPIRGSFLGSTKRSLKPTLEMRDIVKASGLFTPEELKRIQKIRSAKPYKFYENLKTVNEEKAKSLFKKLTVDTSPDIYIPTNIYNKIKPYIQATPEEKNIILDTLSKVNKSVGSVWKGSILSLIPQYHMNNVIDNTLRVSVNRPDALPYMKQAVDLQMGKKVKIYTPQGVKEIGLNDIVGGGFLGGQYGSKEFKAIQSIINNPKGVQNKLQQIADKTGKTLKAVVIDFGFYIGNFIEDTPRLALTLAEFEKGNNLKNTSKVVDDIFYNPDALTESNKWLRDNMFPFWGFITSNIGQTARLTSRKPYVPITINKLNEFSKGQEEGIYGLFEDKPIDRTFEDEYIQNYKNMKIGDKYYNIGSKFSYLEPFSYINQSLDNPVTGTSKFFVDSLGVQKTILESVANIDFDKKRAIDPKKEAGQGETMDKFLGKDFNKQSTHFLKSTFRLLRIIDEALKDPNAQYGSPESQILSIENVKKNLPSIIFGKGYENNVNKATAKIKTSITHEQNDLRRSIQELERRRSRTKDTEQYKIIRDEIKSQNERIKELDDAKIELDKEAEATIKELEALKNSIPNIKEKEETFKKTETLQRNIANDVVDESLLESTTGKILDVIDGDTLIVELDTPKGKHLEYVRVGGINAIDSTENRVVDPSNPYGRISDKVNTELYTQTSNEMINLVNEFNDKELKFSALIDDRDIYGRAVVWIEADDKSLNEEIAKRGLALPIKKFEDAENFIDIPKEFAEKLDKATYEAFTNNLGIHSKMRYSMTNRGTPYREDWAEQFKEEKKQAKKDKK